MHKHLQPILFFTFVAAFLITAPLVVLYTAGFRYEFGNNTIVKTGVLSVSTIPKGALLSVDGKDVSTKTPVVVDTILPGTHLLTIQKEGFFPWKKELEVFSQSTTFADNVVLFGSDKLTFVRKSATPEPITPPPSTTTFEGKTVQVSSLQDRSILAFTDDANISTIISYLPVGTYTFESAPSNLLFLVDANSHRLIIVDPNREQPVLFNQIATLYDWQLDRSRLLFSDGFDLQIYHANDHTSETLTRLSEHIVDLSWYPKGEVVLYATSSKLVALELDRRGSQNRFDLGILDRIDSFSLDATGDLLTVVGAQNEQEGIFQKHLQ